MRLIVGCAVVSLAACGGRFHTELVGSGTAVITPRGAPAPAEPDGPPGVAVSGNPPGATPVSRSAGDLQLPAGSYELTLAFDIPRAQVIEWRLACTGTELTGAVGETFEEYRDRRLAQLRELRERDRRRVAWVAGAIAGAAPLPRVAGGAHVAGPGGEAAVRGEVAVDADAVGEAAARAAVPDEPLALPPGDVGRGRLVAKVSVQTAADGACALSAATDDPDVLGSFQVVRIRDLDAEARARRMAVASGAVQVRARVAAHLVALGADPAARAARLEVEARARRATLEAAAAAEARIRFEAEAKRRVKIVYEDRRTARALEERGLVIAYLVGRCQADPGRRERRADLERRERERRLNADAELVARIEADSQRARTHLRGYLIALGAKARPPRPAPKPEVPGDPPFEGAEWLAGAWHWEDAAWIWLDGAWSDPERFGFAGGAGAGAGGAAAVGLGVFGGRVGHIRDHRAPLDPSQPTVRDHRDGRGDGFSPAVRDHRDGKRDSFSPTVRDHRDGKRDSFSPTVRDHRDGKRDSSPTVRDHRDGKRDSKKQDDDDDKPSRNTRDHRRR